MNVTKIIIIKLTSNHKNEWVFLIKKIKKEIIVYQHEFLKTHKLLYLFVKVSFKNTTDTMKINTRLIKIHVNAKKEETRI